MSDKPKSLRDLALEIAAVTTMVDHLTIMKDELRDSFQRTAAELGADASKAMWEGKEIAKISLINPKPKPYIIDEKAFITFVKLFHADEIVESVRESFKKVFLDRIVPHEDGAIDPETGELFDFVEFREGKPYISTRFQPEGRTRILEAIENRNLPLAIGSSE
jgi:hypothetical protein